VLAVLVASGCGGSSPSTPSGTPTPAPTGHDVRVVVFYDENGDGVMDGSERARVPNALVDVGGRTGRSEKGTGLAIVSGVPSGSFSAAIRSLPPFYVSGTAVSVQVPQPAGPDPALPVTLPIGDNHPNTYMAFGDSISVGVGSSDGTGYRGPLEALLRESFAVAQVLDRGAEATMAGEGAERIGRGLRALKPAYTLTLYGTNDWNDPVCRDAFPCNTIDSLTTIVRTVKEARSLPFLATIIPANPKLNPPERNDWVHRMNALIRPMAGAEGAVLVDLEAAFLRESDLSSLFSDHVHPNDRGYQIMAREFLAAIVGSGSGSLDLTPPGFGFDRPAWRAAPPRPDLPLPRGDPAPSDERRPNRRKANRPLW
jgi:lysophospholipase L1-like esterase